MQGIRFNELFGGQHEVSIALRARDLIGHTHDIAFDEKAMDINGNAGFVSGA